MERCALNKQIAWKKRVHKRKYIVIVTANVVSMWVELVWVREYHCVAIFSEQENFFALPNSTKPNVRNCCRLQPWYLRIWTKTQTTKICFNNATNTIYACEFNYHVLDSSHLSYIFALVASLFSRMPKKEKIVKMCKHFFLLKSIGTSSS